MSSHESKTVAGAARLSQNVQEFDPVDRLTRSLARLRAIADRQFAADGILQTLLNGLPDYIFVKDLMGRFLIVNDALAHDIGQPDGTALIGKDDFFIHARPLAQEIFEREQRVLETGVPMIDVEEYIVNSEGQVLWFLSTKLPVRDTDGEIVGLIGVCRNITERKRAEILRHQYSDILELIARNHPEDLILTRIIQLIESQIDGSVGSVLHLDPTCRFLSGGIAPNLPAAYSRALEGVPIGPTAGSCGAAAYLRRNVLVDDVLTHPNWEPFRAIIAPTGLRSCWSMPVLSEAGDVLATFAIYSRSVRMPTANELSIITLTARLVGLAIERRQSEERIRFLALHDPLTGLPNRTLLKNRLDEAIAAATSTDRRIAVAFLDLDNFKIVNDSLGHGAGDLLLKRLAERMASMIGPPNMIARIGGDEFIVLLQDVPDTRAGLLERLEEIRITASRPISCDGNHYSLSSSVGVAVFPDDGRDADTLISNADAALYRAKALGRDNTQSFTSDLRREIQDHLVLHGDLKTALAEDGLELHYQPQIDLRTGRIVAVEALVRWNHPKFGLLPPSRFIPIAETTGLDVLLGDWVLRQACRQGAIWRAAGFTDLTVCANISAHQFREGVLERQVAEALAESGFASASLELEITESMLMHDEAQAVATMQSLRALGLTFSIDDFGTGYSSFASLKRFPVSRIKIDKTFIRDLDQDSNDRAITAAIILMAQKLNLEVVAEGVETVEQETFLRECGCDLVQGYLHGRPAPAAEIGRLLAAARGDGAAPARD